jgi:hypothetical protein
MCQQFCPPLSLAPEEGRLVPYPAYPDDNQEQEDDISLHDGTTPLLLHQTYTLPGTTMGNPLPSHKARPKSNVSFGEIQEKSAALMNLCSNQDLRKDLLRYFVRAENRIRRNGLNINAHFDMDPMIRPVAGVTRMGAMTSQPNASIQNRKKSATEIHGQRRGNGNTKGKSRKRQTCTLSAMGPSNDSDFITHINQSDKSCSICKGLEHERPSCPKLKKWGVSELGFGNDKSGTARLQLAHNLWQANTFLVEFVDPLDAKTNPPRTSTPRRGVKGIVIQKQLMDNATGTFFFGCTLLSNCGDPLLPWTRTRFTVDAVTQFINKTVSSIIINALELGGPTNNVTAGPGSSFFPLINPPCPSKLHFHTHLSRMIVLWRPWVMVLLTTHTFESTYYI